MKMNSIEVKTIEEARELASKLHGIFEGPFMDIDLNTHYIVWYI